MFTVLAFNIKIFDTFSICVSPPLSMKEPLRKHNLIFVEFFETFKFAAILAHHLFKPYSHQSLNMVKIVLVRHGLKFFPL